MTQRGGPYCCLFTAVAHITHYFFDVCSTVAAAFKSVNVLGVPWCFAWEKLKAILGKNRRSLIRTTHEEAIQRESHLK